MPKSLSLKSSTLLLSLMVAMTPSSVTPKDLGAQEAPATAYFTHAELQNQRASSGRPYLPFLDVPTMRAGLYELTAGSEDGQQPHDKDELYYVVEGRGRFTAGGETTDVGPGSVLFVAAEVDHRFHDITSDLSILVVFSESDPTAGPAKGSENEPATGEDPS